MKHKNYDMIVAKAKNMNLVLFVNSKSDDEGSKTWKKCCGNVFPNNVGDVEYFLCLPQHKEVCLSWLNGANVICANQDARDGLIHAYNGTWSCNHYFMSSLHVMRIKPKKEKRWIIVDPKTDYTFNGLFMQKDEADEENGGVHQVIEIEVEV